MRHLNLTKHNSEIRAIKAKRPSRIRKARSNSSLTEEEDGSPVTIASSDIGSYNHILKTKSKKLVKGKTLNVKKAALLQRLRQSRSGNV
jgi:hypothetical protein